MAIYFLDSSAVVKLYVQEAGTAWLKNLTTQHTLHDFFMARITDVEVVSGLVRRGRAGSLTASDLKAAVTQLRLDLTELYLHIEIDPTLIASAMSLAETHALRGYDAVQLAAVLALNKERLAARLPLPTLMSADAALNAAASSKELLWIILISIRLESRQSLSIFCCRRLRS